MHRSQSQSARFSPEPSTSHSQIQLWSQSQSSQQTSSQSNNVPIDKLCDDVVLFLLCCKTNMKPIKKNTIIKHFQNLGKKKVFNEVMNKVQEKLEDIFGLKLIEKAHNKTVQYLLINGLINKLDLNVEQKAKLESEKMILLLIILCAIYKSGSRLKEENLLEFLKNADFIVDVKKPVKGKGRFKDLDVVKFLRQELTGMSYLVCTELEMECEEKTYEYKWGERAKNEVSYDKIEKLYESIDSVELEENMMIDGDGDNNYYFGDVMITDK
ncbi:non-structural maintenance of chromosomes element 3 homolog isoform X2 [Lycorma delicatula]